MALSRPKRRSASSDEAHQLQLPLLTDALNECQHLRAELNQLRQENAMLKAENLRLKASGGASGIQVAEQKADYPLTPTHPPASETPTLESTHLKLFQSQLNFFRCTCVLSVSGIVPFERPEGPGSHRRIRFEDLMEYKHKRAEERRQQLKRLTRLSQDAGLYDQ